MLQDPAGIKPLTFWLPVRGTSDWAMEASLFLISPTCGASGKLYFVIVEFLDIIAHIFYISCESLATW